MLVVGVVAGVIFFPSLILRGPYFTLVSIAFAESIRQFIINSEFFGRASGVGLPFGKDSFAQFRFTSKVPYYYIGFIMMVGVYLIMKKIGRSSWALHCAPSARMRTLPPPSASTHQVQGHCRCHFGHHCRSGRLLLRQLHPLHRPRYYDPVQVH